MGKRILYINQEITPFVPESELSTIGTMALHNLQDAGFEIRTFMPKWGTINERRGQLHEVQRLSGMNIIINDTDHPLIIKVASIPQTKIQVYFIDNEEYFIKAKSDDDVPTTSCGERAIFFARGVIETMKKLRWSPDIIHCQGWMSAVVPLYIKTAYHDEPSFANTKVVTSFFNNSLKKDLGKNFKQSIEVREAKAELLTAYNDHFDFEELGKMAIDYSDGIILADDDVNKMFAEYAKDRIPVLDYNPDFADAYEAFFNQICPESQE